MADWHVFSGGTTSVLSVQDDGVHVGDRVLQWAQLQRIDFTPRQISSVLITLTEAGARDLDLDDDWALGFRSTAEQQKFQREVQARLAVVEGGERPSTPVMVTRSLTAIDSAFITTLPALPGYRIARVLGLVSQLSATSGFTATVKGQGALNIATGELIAAAQRLGANAVVGVSASPFGAGGGITSAFGGDAVGVLMLGTAVVVEAGTEQGLPP